MAQEANKRKSSAMTGYPISYFWRPLMVLMGVLFLITLLGALTLQPMQPGMFSNIFVYMFVFLGAGLLVVACMNRYLDQYNQNYFPEE